MCALNFVKIEQIEIFKTRRLNLMHLAYVHVVSAGWLVNYSKLHHKGFISIKGSTLEM